MMTISEIQMRVMIQAKEKEVEVEGKDRLKAKLQEPVVMVEEEKV